MISAWASRAIFFLKQTLDFRINAPAVRQCGLHQSAVLKNTSLAVKDGIKSINKPCLDGFLIRK